MKWHSSTPEVLIVGAGPVGMMTALALARQNMPVRVIDEAPGPCTYSYGLALHRPVLALLKEFGYLEELMAFVCPLKHLSLNVESENLGSFDLRDALGEEDLPSLVTLSQAILERYLSEKLSRHGVKIDWSYRLRDLQIEREGVRGSIERLEERMTGYAVAHFEYAAAETQTFRVPYLIASDGWGSRCRHLMGIEWKTQRPSREYAVFEFETQSELEGEMTLVFRRGGTNVGWPLDRHRCRWSFELDRDWTSRNKDREKERHLVHLGGYEYACPERSVLDHLLAQRVPFSPHVPERLTWRMVVPFGCALAAEFQRGRCCLVGDASHIAAPGGVQSMNAGLLEGAHLGETLARVLRDEMPSDAVVRLQRQTRDAWEIRLGSDGRIGLRRDADQRLQGYASKLFESLPASGNNLVQLADRVGLALPEDLASMLSTVPRV